MKVERFLGNPILSVSTHPETLDDLPGNINGPSVIRVPDWVKNPLGKYYMYYGHHRGTYIRLAYADYIEGPWFVYAPGVLKMEDAYAIHHIASPDVHIDNDQQIIRMYYHSPIDQPRQQRTRVATSHDGINFSARPEILGAPYLRVLYWDGFYYAVGMPGIFYRSSDPLSGFVEGPTLFGSDQRHVALLKDGDTLNIFHTFVGDEPESILLSRVDVSGDWMSWNASESQVLLKPERSYEGGYKVLEPSKRGPINERVMQLRDPAIFKEDGKIYLFYVVAGEQGIALAKIFNC
ncbi:MAG: hypothetical protein ACJ0A3_03790 [Dehalococcoidia bacterium]